MTDERNSLDVTLTREFIGLSAHAMALQIVLESLFKRIDGDEFRLDEFRAELRELTAKCREKVLLDFEQLNPGIAAFLDANRPLTDESDDAA